MSQDKTSCYVHIGNSEKVKIDKEDLKRVNEHTWHIVKQKNCTKRQVLTNVKTPTGSKKMSLGQFLMSPPEGKFVYPRRSAAELDFTKGNLIVCSMKQRQIMLPKRKGKCSSQYKGVAWDKTHKLWRAHLDIDGNTKVLGYFKDEAEAALAYNTKVSDVYGDIAYQNRIDQEALQRIEDLKNNSKVAA